MQCFFCVYLFVGYYYFIDDGRWQDFWQMQYVVVVRNDIQFGFWQGEVGVIGINNKICCQCQFKVVVKGIVVYSCDNWFVEIENFG